MIGIDIEEVTILRSNWMESRVWRLLISNKKNGESSKEGHHDVGGRFIDAHDCDDSGGIGAVTEDVTEDKGGGMSW